MKIYAPEYYKEFKCTANKCKNSCCIGWEIDVDGQTYEKYRKVQGAFAARLLSCISNSADSDRHFILDEGDRCPFLNEDNLCDIYIELGEESLCDICRDHPRFRNFYDCRTEVGLGLCCEAAADLILDWKQPFALVAVGEDDAEEQSDDLENMFFALRKKAFEIIQDGTIDAEESAENLLEAFGQSTDTVSFENKIRFFLSLEILDDEWKRILENALMCNKFDYSVFKSRDGQNVQRQLLLYFVYRHTAEGVYNETFGAWIRFSVLGLEMIKTLCAANEKPSIRYFKELARRYSAEIEYSEENTEKLLELLCMN